MACCWLNLEGEVKITVLSGLIALSVQSANALELKVGDQIPGISGEAIIVGNDGGVKRGTQAFDFGQVCHVSGWIKDWLLVTRIVGDWTLLELVGPMRGEEQIIADPSSLADECPLGTETSRPTSEMRARLNQYARDTDYDLTQTLHSSVGMKP
jgi:hypothetical protein